MKSRCELDSGITSDLLEDGKKRLLAHMAGPTSDLYEACGNAMVDEIERFMNNKSLKYEVSAESLRYMTAKG